MSSECGRNGKGREGGRQQREEEEGKREEKWEGKGEEWEVEKLKPKRVDKEDVQWRDRAE